MSPTTSSPPAASAAVSGPAERGAAGQDGEQHAGRGQRGQPAAQRQGAVHRRAGGLAGVGGRAAGGRGERAEPGEVGEQERQRRAGGPPHRAADGDDGHAHERHQQPGRRAPPDLGDGGHGEQADAAQRDGDQRVGGGEQLVGGGAAGGEEVAEDDVAEDRDGGGDDRARRGARASRSGVRPASASARRRRRCATGAAASIAQVLEAPGGAVRGDPPEPGDQLAARPAGGRPRPARARAGPERPVSPAVSRVTRATAASDPSGQAGGDHPGVQRRPRRARRRRRRRRAGPAGPRTRPWSAECGPERVTGSRPGRARARRRRSRAAAVSSDSRSGRESRKPWAKPQPRPRSTPSWAGVSTPSATTSRPRARPIAMTDSHSARLRGCRSTRATKSRSSLSTSMGSALRWVSEELAGAEVVEGDVHAHQPQRLDVDGDVVGVGHQRRLGDLQDEPLGRQAGAGSTAATSPTRVRAATCEAEMLTPSCSGGVETGSETAARAACSSSPALQLADHAGALRDRHELAGGTSPSSGCRQRSSASTPTIRCSSRETTGWKTTASSPRARAPGRSSRSRARRSAAAPRAARTGGRCRGRPSGRRGRRSRPATRPRRAACPPRG